MFLFTFIWLSSKILLYLGKNILSVYSQNRTDYFSYLKIVSYEHKNNYLHGNVNKNVEIVCFLLNNTKPDSVKVSLLFPNVALF